MRKAAFHLLDVLYHRSDAIDLNKMVDAVIAGLADGAEDALVLNLSILSKLSQKSCVIVLSRIDAIVAAFENLFRLNLKLV